MKTFKDSTGREWTIEVNTVTAKRVRSLLDVDLFKVVEDRGLLTQLGQDPIFLVDLLYVVCKPQADALTVSVEEVLADGKRQFTMRRFTDEDFGAAMVGDAVEDGATALIEDLISFSPRPSRETLGQIWKMSQEAASKARLDVAERVTKELPGVIERALASAGGSLTGVPESSVSTPGPSPSPS